MADHTSTTNHSANPTPNDTGNPTGNPTGFQPENSTPNHTPSRRQLLAGGSALAFSGVALTGAALSGGKLLSGISPALDAFLAPEPAASSDTPGPDPAYAAYRRAQRAEDALNSYQGAENEYYAGLAMAFLEAREVLASTPSSSLRGIHSKVMWFGEAQDWRVGDSFFESLLGLSILNDLERLMAQSSNRTGGAS